MKYKNYVVSRFNELNWITERTDKLTAAKDIISKTKPGVILHKEGETYSSVVRLGYFPDVGLALNSIVRDLAGIGCKDIKDLAHQISGIKKDLRLLVKASKEV